MVDQRNRAKVHSFRLNQDEELIFRKMAIAAGLSDSEYIRERILSGDKGMEPLGRLRDAYQRLFRVSELLDRLEPMTKENNVMSESLITIRKEIYEVCQDLSR